MRLVSLTCSNTEIVCALGCGSALVGVDHHSDYPQAVLQGLTRVGRDLQIDLQRVADLRPDLVLASLTVPGHEHIVDGLEAAGLPFEVLEPTRLAHVYRDIERIAQLLGVAERGRQLVRRMQAAMPPVRSQKAPGVLVEWWPKPVIAPGRESWVSDLLRLAGARNPWQARPVKSTPLEADCAELKQLDAIVISWCGVDPRNYRPELVARRSGWHDLPAVREQRIFCIPEAYLGRPGPRLVQGYGALRDLVLTCHPRTPAAPEAASFLARLADRFPRSGRGSFGSERPLGE
jgi:iron complex transport system substrate-binding protein